MPQKIRVSLDGLHCRACEIINEQNFRSLPGVVDAKIDYRTGQADIYYEGQAPTRESLKGALAEGYKLIEEQSSACEIPSSQERTNWQLIIPLLILVYWLFNRLDIGGISGFLGGEFSMPLALVIGLAAGFSTCLALVGGLVFGLAANYAKHHPQASRAQKFFPHIYFNLGRLVGFFLLGGILGALGSAFRFSPFFNGLLTIFIGLVILVLGLKLLGSSALKHFEIALPKKLSEKIKADNPWLLGALTFFLPCGFTQAVQIYALGSGSFLSGALIMSLFALGTAPGLLSIGGLVAVIKQKHSSWFFKIAGGVLVLFSIFNIQNGWNLTRVGINYNNYEIKDASINNYKEGDFQIVKMVESNRGYVPNKLEIRGDKPVRWIIDAQSPYSCASYLVVSSLGIEKALKPGENIIEFTPPASGIIPFSCSMGMYNGSFHIVND